MLWIVSRMLPHHKKCLLLNADFSPLVIIGWKKAITWLYKDSNNIEVISYYENDFIQGSAFKKYRIPAVLKTSVYYKLTSHKVNFSRKNVFIRDNFSCQYCGANIAQAQLTYDHVTPKSAWDYIKGSPTNWTNIVTACVLCNNRKGNRTPDQANMKIINSPIVPRKHKKYLPVSAFLAKIKKDIPSEWSTYIF